MLKCLLLFFNHSFYEDLRATIQRAFSAELQQNIELQIDLYIYYEGVLSECHDEFWTFSVRPSMLAVCQW